MQTLMDSGIALIIAFQGMGDWLIAPMRFFSELGTEDFFFLALPFIYWSVNPGLGLRVALILAASNMVNYIAKLAFASPRPYWVSSHVRPLWPEASFGVPSGHAQHAVAVWGVIAAPMRKTWVRIVCVLLIVMIGISRVYLGSHFLHDVIVGWLIGAAILWAALRYWDSTAAWLAGKSLAQQIGVAAVVSILFVAVGWVAATARAGFQMPVDWMENALRGADLPPAPIDRNGIFTVAGSFFGLAAGVAWIHSKGGYQVPGPVWKRAACFVIGLVGVLILWMGLGELFPRGDSALVYSLRFLRYALTGWWVTGGAPRLFQHFNLSAPPARSTSI